MHVVHKRSLSLERFCFDTRSLSRWQTCLLMSQLLPIIIKQKCFDINTFLSLVKNKYQLAVKCKSNAFISKFKCQLLASSAITTSRSTCFWWKNSFWQRLTDDGVRRKKPHDSHLKVLCLIHVFRHWFIASFQFSWEIINDPFVFLLPAGFLPRLHRNVSISGPRIVSFAASLLRSPPRGSLQRSFSML